MAHSASVSVDVDSLWHYYRIHGLNPAEASNQIWSHGVPRFMALFEQLGISATFFCVAEDLEREENIAGLKALVEAGHEIGNHSWHHHYELSRLPPLKRRAEVEEGRRRLEAASAAPVQGFRSPGYTTNAALQVDLLATGHRYDSSVFPCPPYYLAKAAVLAWMNLRDRQSQSILDHPRIMWAPRAPYLADVGAPHRRGADGLPQYPISVALGVPLIGTAFSLLGRLGSLLALEAGLRLQDHLTLEFHALDLLGLKEDQLDPALGVQPDLRIPLKRKEAIFRALLARLKGDAQILRLDRLASADL